MERECCEEVLRIMVRRSVEREEGYNYNRYNSQRV